MTTYPAATRQAASREVSFAKIQRAAQQFHRVSSASDEQVNGSAGGGVNSSVILKNIVSDPNAEIYDMATFNALPVGDLVIPTPVVI